MDWKILFTDINFIIIQIVGALAWLFLYLSYHRKTTNKILIFQIIANILFIIHYFCLGAYTGLAICFVEIIFDYLYYKTNDDKLLFKVSVPLRILCGVLTYGGPIDILPIVASINDGYALTFRKKKLVRGAITTYVLWFIYDLSTLSISGAITDAIIVITNVCILLFNFNIFKTLKKIKKKL